MLTSYSSSLRSFKDASINSEMIVGFIGRPSFYRANGSIRPSRYRPRVGSIVDAATLIAAIGSLSPVPPMVRAEMPLLEGAGISARFPSPSRSP